MLYKVSADSKIESTTCKYSAVDPESQEGHDGLFVLVRKSHKKDHQN